jgi:hypothetical protein
MLAKLVSHTTFYGLAILYKGIEVQALSTLITATSLKFQEYLMQKVRALFIETVL